MNVRSSTVAPLRALLLGHPADETNPAWSPASLDGLVGWWRAESLSHLGDGNPVAAWPDDSSAHNDAAQATTSKRPVFRASPARVVFDGADDFLATAAPALSATGDCTLWIVARMEASAPPNTCFCCTGANTGLGLTADGGSGLGGLVGGLQWFGDSSDGRGRYLYMRLLRVAGSVSLSVNGVAIPVGSVVTPSPSSGATYLGSYDATSACACEIAECGMCDDALSDDDRALLDTYIRTTYGGFFS